MRKFSNFIPYLFLAIWAISILILGFSKDPNILMYANTTFFIASFFLLKILVISLKIFNKKDVA